ncbi:DAACS family dicarboxylate/amino acid:cation (Na+ or H+) symporter [Sphingomonas zeicaulis]|uniref:dicarboxylate/amino acid:cation symporter n=1 Tax=Sphingomonas zeicaulis TaxID=1632740 RepID=UPI003D1D33D8
MSEAIAETEIQPGKPRRSRLHWRMAAGFAIGTACGLVAHFLGGDAPWLKTVTDYVTGPIGQLFLRLLFMLVIPLLFSALVMGVAGMGEMRSLKRIGLNTLVLTVIVSSIAVVVSLLLVNGLQPGRVLDQGFAQELLANSSGTAKTLLERSPESKTGIDALLAIVPVNPVAAMAENDILAVMFFALAIGIGLLLVREEETNVLKQGIEGLFAISMKLIGLVIKLAPVAVFCFMFNLTALFGWDLLLGLSAYVGVVIGALGIQTFIVFPILLLLLAERNPLTFFGDVQEAGLMAFSTASSNATLPTALRIADENLHLPPRVARFVLTIGATANQNGTAMFEGVTVIFLAQFFGVDLTLSQQLMVMGVCILGGIGTAGVPAGSLPVVAMILGTVEVPPAGIGLVLGVDRFLDMSRTALNVVGDLVLATIVAHREPDGAAA